MHRTAGDWLANAGRVLFLGLIVFAAAAYGLTRDWTIDWFNHAAFVAFAAWLLGHLVALRAPATGILPWLLVLLILGLGWGVTGLGYADDLLVETDEEYPDLYYEIAGYGSFSASSSFTAMLRVSALLLLFLMAIDLFARPGWGRVLLATLAATGAGMTVFFYLQKTFGEPFLIRDIWDRTFLNFATYRYWGNGASFLGLLWPLPAAIALFAGFRRAAGWSLWMATALLVFGALYLNKSKAGHVLGLVGLILFVLLALTALARSGVFRRLDIRPSVVLIILVPLAAIAVSLYFAIPQKRWDHMFDKGLDRNVRLIAYEYFVEMVPIAGWTGYGPGTFGEAHRPFVEEDKRIRKIPFWVAHQDYLQTVIEWGYAGTILWGLLLVPSSLRLLVRAFRVDRSAFREADREAFGWQERCERFADAIPAPGNPLVQAAALTAIVVTALHAAVDFPMQIASLQLYFLIWTALGWVPAKSLKPQS